MQHIPAHGDAGFYGTRVPFLIFRPSLLNISSLGTPEEVVGIFESVMGTSDTNAQLRDAMAVLWACADDKELAIAAVGHIEPGEDPFEYVPGETSIDRLQGPEYIQGEMPIDHVIHLARHMLHHGMVGDVEIKPADGKQPKPMKEFKAADFVAMAIAHLGMSQSDAWALSMTALVAALNSKFPDAGKKKEGPGGNAPTVAEHDDAMEWFKKIRGK